MVMWPGRCPNCGNPNPHGLCCRCQELKGSIANNFGKWVQDTEINSVGTLESIKRDLRLKDKTTLKDFVVTKK